MDTYSVIIHFKTENFYEDVYDVEKRFGKSNDEVNRLLPTKKKKSDWINKRSIKRKNYDGVSCT